MTHRNALPGVYVWSLLAGAVALPFPPLGQWVSRGAILILLAACGAPADAAPEWPEAPDVRLAPEPDLAAVTREAAARWQAATGLAVEVGAEGVPVRFETMVGDAGAAPCGQTRFESWAFDPRELVVNRERGTCGSVARTVAHELGHLLCALGGQPPEEGCHTGSGVMRPGSTDERIDAATLAAVCAAVLCPALDPED